MQKKEVFLIDHDKVTNFLNKLYVSSFDKSLDIITFTEAIDALKALQQKAPDVIFLDINMPDMDGWEFLNECQKLEVSCKIYLLSNSLSPADRQRSKLYSQVTDFFVKPLTNTDLQKILG